MTGCRRHVFVIFLGIAALPLVVGSCVPKDTSVPLEDAYSEIYAAIDYKGRACGGRPAVPLILPDKPPQYGTHLCALSIIRRDCPFNDYPVFCLELFFNLPGIGP